MAWTSPTDLRTQVQKLWDTGNLLCSLALRGRAGVGAALDPEASFPLRLKLISPSSTDLATRLPEVRLWAAELRQHAVHYRLTERAVRHREVGHQSLPAAAWVDSLDAATTLIGKTKETQQYQDLWHVTGNVQPGLLAWLARRPLTALALATEWPRLLAVVAWLQNHPRPGIYLRQVDIAGVDSKFIEAQRSVLAELLDMVLTPAAIDFSANGASQFARRYGFVDKPLRIRFRLFDGSAFGTDISVTQAAFARLAPAVTHVFITENEVNFLAFPSLPGTLVVFGAGYGFEALAGVAWLHRCAVCYWGDIDTHGFAILDQLRAYLPHAQSLLMDEATLQTHADHWGHEPQPQQRDLRRLTAEEGALYDQLRDNRIQPGLRLEQERIGFGWVQQALADLSR